MQEKGDRTDWTSCLLGYRKVRFAEREKKLIEKCRDKYEYCEKCPEKQKCIHSWDTHC